VCAFVAISAITVQAIHRSFRNPSINSSIRQFVISPIPMNRLSISWLGHSTFILGTPGGKRVLFDPWLATNPSCPESMKKPPTVDLILASHGHFDHIEDLIACARESNAPVVGIFELCDWLGRKGIQNVSPMIFMSPKSDVSPAK